MVYWYNGIMVYLKFVGTAMDWIVNPNNFYTVAFIPSVGVFGVQK